MSQVLLNLPNISCGHCVLTIKRALGPLEGVRAVEVDIANRQVSVDFDAAAVDLDRIEQVLADEDYPVARESGDNSAAAATSEESMAGCACCAG